MILAGFRGCLKGGCAASNPPPAVAINSRFPFFPYDKYQQTIYRQGSIKEKPIFFDTVKNCLTLLKCSFIRPLYKSTVWETVNKPDSADRISIVPSGLHRYDNSKKGFLSMQYHILWLILVVSTS